MVCSVEGCDEIAIALRINDTEVRERNKHIQTRFEQPISPPRKATPKNVGAKTTTSCQVPRRRVSTSSADNTSNADSLDMPGLSDFQMGPTWSGDSSGRSVVPISKGGKREQLRALFSDDSSSSEEGVSPRFNEKTQVSTTRDKPDVPIGMVTSQGKKPDTSERESSSDDGWLDQTSLSKKNKKVVQDPSSSLKHDKRRRPDFWSESTARTTEAPVPITLGERNAKTRDGWNRVADAIALAITNREGKDLEKTSEQMKSFVVEAMRGFGLYRYSMGIGSFGKELIRAAKRESHVKKHDMYRAGWRFPLTWRHCKALETLKLGSHDYRKEGEETLILSDFHPVFQEMFDNAVIIGAKLGNRNKHPVSLSAFVSCVEQQALFTQGFYGVEHGLDRDEALKFFVDMRKTSPDIFSIEFLVDVWERFNADYVDSIYEGVRGMLPFLDKISTMSELKKVALAPTSERRTFWREPGTWKIRSIKGFSALYSPPRIAV